MRVIVTGGLGYIGSHTVVQLLQKGYEVIVVDNLCNSHERVKENIKQITGKDFISYYIDLRNEEELSKVFKTHKINSVIHFAALKAVGESVEKPLEYYDNNLISTINLLKEMTKHNINNFVFSSSATVYGLAETVPIKEASSLSVTNPYGRTKLMIEDVLRDISRANDNFNIAILRYFNPIGAHKSGLIGEEPNGIPNNLMPYITKVANGELDYLRVFGDDYETSDGTGVRDYIHVEDLANGHLKALDKLSTNPGLVTYNLGTGTGYSVLDLINTFERVNNIEVPFKIVERRAGDIGVCYADPTKANNELGWGAEKNIEDMCRDSWNFTLKNTNKHKVLEVV